MAFGIAINKALNSNPIGALLNLLPDGVTWLAGGTLAEMLGNGLQAMGDPNRTLAARYNPALNNVLRSIGGTAQDVGDSALEYGLSRINPRNNDEYLGSLRNAYDSGFYGVLQGDASMVKADKSVSAFEEAIRRLADENQIAPSWSLDYILSPHGLIRSFGNMAGSMAAILPSMALAPESAFMAPANAVTRGLINRGAYGLARRTADRLPNYLQYASTSTPAESFSEGGHVRTENLAKGMSDAEATRRGWNTAFLNLPILLGSNFLEAGLLGTPFKAGSALSKLFQAGWRTGGNALLQGTEEALQKAASNSQTGKEYGLLPWNWTPDQWQDFSEGFAGTLPMGIAGSGAHAISEYRRPAETAEERADREAYERGSDERISVGDFSNRAEKQGRNLQSSRGIDSFMRAIGGQESGGNYDAVNYDAGEMRGKYQIDVNNWASWAKDAGLSPDAPMTPENQEIVARNKMLEYYNKFGNWRDVAIAWYGGEGAVNWSDEAKNRPQQGKYPSVNEYADSVMSRFDRIAGSDESQGITYLDDDGKGEGRYWVRQGDNVSFDGAQPDLLNAVDILGKFFYDRTGKMLVVTAGTNGDHAAGEHSHGAGWKVDIADAGANGVGLNEDGALFTADYKAQPFLKEFIEFGRNLGLGMNLEAEGTPNVHIDVALDGHQWDGNGENAGGFSRERVSEYGKARARGGATSRQDTSAPPRTQNPPQNQPPKEEEPPKPLFDLNDPKFYEDFANEKRNATTGQEAYEAENFFAPMFNDKGEFKNTDANRKAIRDHYGTDFTDWVSARQQNTQPPVQPPQPEPPKTKQPPAPPKARFDINDPKLYEDFISEKIAEEIRNGNSDSDTLDFLLGLHNEAREFQNTEANRQAIRERYGNDFTDWVTARQQDTQPPQAENVVQNNKPPENVLPSPKFGADENLAAQEVSREKTPIGIPESRIQQAKAIMRVANFNRVELPEPLKISLRNGDTKGIMAAQEILREKGLIPAQPQPTAQPKVQEPPTPQPQAQQKNNEEKSHIIRVTKATHPGNMTELERQIAGGAFGGLRKKTTLKYQMKTWRL